MDFHHIGIAVKNIEKSEKIYRDLGYQSFLTIEDPIQNVNLCFLQKPNSPTLELVCPVGNESPIVNTLKKNGSTPYHTCYQVKNIKEKIYDLKLLGFRQISEVVPAKAFKNRLVCFLYNKEIGLIELLNK